MASVASTITGSLTSATGVFAHGQVPTEGQETKQHRNSSISDTSTSGRSSRYGVASAPRKSGSHTREASVQPACCGTGRATTTDKAVAWGRGQLSRGATVSISSGT